MKIKLVYILVILSVLIMGCAKPPTAEMESAVEAVFRAENDPDAVLYAGAVLSRARDSISRMEAEAANKQYDAAKTLSAEAIALAERAIAEGRAGAARARDEAAALMAGLGAEIDEAERNINGARYNGLPLDYAELERDIRNVHDAADRALASQAEGRHQEALDITRDIRSDLTNINGRVATAATAAGKK